MDAKDDRDRDSDQVAREKRAERLLKAAESALSADPAESRPLTPRELANRAAAAGSDEDRPKLQFKKK